MSTARYNPFEHIRDDLEELEQLVDDSAKDYNELLTKHNNMKLRLESVRTNLHDAMFSESIMQKDFAIRVAYNELGELV